MKKDVHYRRYLNGGNTLCGAPPRTSKVTCEAKDTTCAACIQALRNGYGSRRGAGWVRIVGGGLPELGKRR